ncbi:MAG TPA: hypothetical protein VHK90_18205 [Thermoanaerobaculia bacterium]|nr:hypothetical protein [Thermoanaerobaculia bacterium]
MRSVFLLLALLGGPAVHAQVLTTEVWLGRLDMREGRFAVTDLQNISRHPGYDNQPAFFPDGASLLFTTEAENVAESGLGVHAVRYFIDSGRSVALTSARGFSPTPTPDGKFIMTLREGSVWLHDIDGKPLENLLPHVKTAGYYTRMDQDRWVLFMNEPDRRIAIWDQQRFSLAKIVPNAITAPYRVPGEMAVTFVVQEGDRKTIKHLALTEDRGSLDREIGVIPFKTGGHHVWTSRGTILMASGNTIYEWDRNRPDDWKVVHRFREPDLQGITRIALGPREDLIALVSVPNDRTVLSESRAAINEGFAGAYVRTPDSWDLATDRAIERGTWVRRWRAGGTDRELHGDYTVTWRKTIGGSGTPLWNIETETYKSRP